MSDIYSDDFPSVRADGPLAISPAVTRAAGAVLFLLLVIGMAVWAYRLGTRDATEVPIIRAMEGPARVQPDDPGGVVAEHQGLEVNSVLAGEPAPEPAEAPAPRIVAPAVILQPEDGPQGELVVAQPQIPVFAMPEAGDLRMPAADEAPDSVAGAGSDTVAALIEAALRAGAEAEPVAATPALRPLGRPSGLAARRPAPSVAGAQAAAATRPPAATTRPALATAASPAPQPQQTAFASAEPAPAAAAREVASVAPGSRLVQLGAFDSEGLARQSWGQLVARHGDLLGARSLFLERATHNARVFYRLRVAGFGTSDETRTLCEALRARGVDCIPVTLN